MGYYGKLDEKKLAQSLRRKGYSYNQILNIIHVSKDTISRWCRDIVLTSKQKQKLLENRLYGQKKGSIVAAENKHRLRIQMTKDIYIDAKSQVGQLSERDQFIAGISLYAAEGTKTDGQGGFANSDPYLIKFMMEWLRQYCNISDNKFRGAIWLHEGNSDSESKLYWSKLTRIPLSQFYKTYRVKSKTNSKKIRKNLHPYGVFSIRFSHTVTHRKIIGWISALFHGKIPGYIDIPL